jgi:hypothetical protein
VTAAAGDDPVGEFCLSLDKLRAVAGVQVRPLARQLGLSRTQLYAILAGTITRPPDWDRVVRPLVAACTQDDAAGLVAWRQQHTAMVSAWEQRRRSRPPGQPARPPAAPGQVPRQLPPAVSGFTGRDSELAALTRLLEPGAGVRASALVISAIGGTAGVGKPKPEANTSNRYRAVA